jgi:(2Fe-2S) ferredoxin
MTTKPLKRIASREELAKLRAEFRAVTLMREVSEEPEKRIEVNVSMATCGIAAGARDTMLAFVDEVAASGLNGTVSVMAVDCVGQCEIEPVVDVAYPGERIVRYKHVDVPMAKRIVKEHLVDGAVVEDALERLRVTMRKGE